MLVDASIGNESVNSTVKRLLENAEKPRQKNMKRTVINLDEDVLEKLNEFKAYEKESYNSVIFRLLISQ